MSAADQAVAPLDLCPKCGRGEMHPHYVAAGGRWDFPRRDCSDRATYNTIDGDCPTNEHLHERCTVCRYERVAWVVAA